MEPPAGGLPRPSPLLEVEELSYDAGATSILRGVSLAVRARELVVVMGASGSGKSTLLRCLNRLLEPTGGVIRLEGADVRDLEPVALRRKVGMVAQLPFMFDGTIRENLERAADYAELPSASSGCGRLLAAVGLDEPFDRDARSLSIGQQQRVAMARALVSRPLVLLCDEPTASLDQASARHLEATLAATAAGGTGIVFVTHDAGQAARIADRRMLLEGGALRPVAARPGDDGA